MRALKEELEEKHSGIVRDQLRDGDTRTTTATRTSRAAGQGSKENEKRKEKWV